MSYIMGYRLLIVFFIFFSTLGKCQTNIDSLPRGTIEDNFEGGRPEFMRVVINKIVFPKELKEQDIFGIVYYSLEIDTIGNIKDFTILKSPAELMSKEVETKIDLTNGKWKPMTTETKMKVNYIIIDYIYFELR